MHTTYKIGRFTHYSLIYSSEEATNYELTLFKCSTSYPVGLTYCCPAIYGKSYSIMVKIINSGVRKFQLNANIAISPEEGHGNPLPYSCLENPHGQRSLKGYSPWGHKELDTTEQLSTQHSCFAKNQKQANNGTTRIP